MSFGLQAVSRLRFPDDLNPKRPKDKQETIVLARPMFPCLSFASLISSSSVLRSVLRGFVDAFAFPQTLPSVCSLRSQTCAPLLSFHFVPGRGLRAFHFVIYSVRFTLFIKHAHIL
jgi:hypothetical protein